MEVSSMEVRRFNIQGDLYILEIFNDDLGDFYKVTKNGDALTLGRRYTEALRAIISDYEIPAIRGRAYTIEGSYYQVIPHDSGCTCNYIWMWDLNNTRNSEFPDEWHCINWILCGYHYRD